MRHLILAGLVAVFTAGGLTMAGDTPLDAMASDPEVLGWMREFPPADDKLIRFTDPDHFAFPKLRWTACHFRELMPSVGVQRGPGKARPFEVALDDRIDTVTFMPLDDGDSMAWDQAYLANYTDGIIVLHHGRI